MNVWNALKNITRCISNYLEIFKFINSKGGEMPSKKLS